MDDRVFGSVSVPYPFRFWTGVFSCASGIAFAAIGLGMLVNFEANFGGEIAGYGLVALFIIVGVAVLAFGAVAMASAAAMRREARSLVDMGHVVWADIVGIEDDPLALSNERASPCIACVASDPVLGGTLRFLSWPVSARTANAWLRSGGTVAVFVNGWDRSRYYVAMDTAR